MFLDGNFNIKLEKLIPSIAEFHHFDEDFEHVDADSDYFDADAEKLDCPIPIIVLLQIPII